MSTNSQHDSVCVIGAGPSGLATVKALRDAGVDCACFEREDDVGGNWYFGKPGSSVYTGTHMISSKRLTEFADFPMPKEFPPYPSHPQALDYLRSFAKAFDLYEQIELNTTVERMEPSDATGWNVFLAGEEAPRQFAHVIIANGHHWSPRFPEPAGDFTGELIHAHDFKTPDVLKRKRVLVIGAGNSGCDIAVEAGQHATKAFLSVRRGYHYLPKFVRGRPIDSGGVRLQRLHVPLWLRRFVGRFYSRLILGAPQRFGLPKPDHALFEAHPIINSQLFYHIGHGRLRVKPDVARYDGGYVEFKDGTREEIDLIVCATGYDIRFPFIDEEYLNWRDGMPKLHLHAVHPHRNDLFIVGMIQPNGGLWPLAELQAKLIARAIASERQGDSGVDKLREQARKIESHVDGGIRFLDSPRHRLEVDYYTFRKQLERLLGRSHRRDQVAPTNGA